MRKKVGENFSFLKWLGCNIKIKTNKGVSFKQNWCTVERKGGGRGWLKSWKNSLVLIGFKGLFPWARLSGPISPWVNMRNYSPVSEMRRPKTSCGAKFEKQSKHGETQSYDFRAYYSFGNPYSCITVFRWDAFDVENTTGKARRCRIHSKSSSHFHPGNRAEVFI